MVVRGLITLSLSQDRVNRISIPFLLLSLKLHGTRVRSHHNARPRSVLLLTLNQGEETRNTSQAQRPTFECLASSTFAR